MNKYNFEIDKGANKSFSILYTNSDNTVFDLTGYSARLHVKETYLSNEVLINLTNSSGIIIDIPLGKLTINFLPSHTASFENITKNYVYDLEIYTTEENVIRLVQGVITVSPEVTR